MADNGVKNGVASAARDLFQRLGPAGLVFVAWTVIVVAAMWKQTEPWLTKEWRWLYWTWIVLAVVWILTTLCVAIVAAWQGRREPGAQAVGPPGGATAQPPAGK